MSNPNQPTPINQLLADYPSLPNDMIEYWSAPFRQEYLKNMLGKKNPQPTESDSYLQQWRELNIPVYPWSLVAGETKPRERMIPVSQLQWIIDEAKACQSINADYALNFVLHNLKRHIDPEQQ